MAAGAATTSFPAAGNDGLGSVATIARRALGCEAVLIGRGSSPGRATLAAAAGAAAGELPSLWRALEATAGERITAGEQAEAATAAGEAPFPGYEDHLWAPLLYEGRWLGTLHALAGDGDGEIDRRLLEAFASHSAVVLAQSGLREHVVRLAEQLRLDEAFDRLALSAETTEQLIPHIDDALEPVLGPVRTGIMVLDEKGATLHLVAGSFGAAKQEAASQRVDLRDLRSQGARVFGLRRPYISNQAEGDPGILQDYLGSFGIDRVMSMPLVVGEEPIGVLFVANKPDGFTVADLDRCLRLASRIAVAVGSTRMLARLRTQQRIESVLSDAAVAVASGTHSADFLPGTFERLAVAIDAAAVVLVPLESEPTMIVEEAVPERALRHLIEEGRAAPSERSRVETSRQIGDPGSAAFQFPIVLGGHHLGTLAVLRSRGEAFSTEERRGLARMGGLIALGWASERYQRQRASLAMIEERQRIADNLHDDVSQLLFAAHMHIDQALEGSALDPALADLLGRAGALLSRADSTIRTEIAELSRPEAGTGLVERLRETAAGVEQEFGVSVRLEIAIAPEDAEGAGPAVRETLLRVAREALVNAAKHAGPCRISAQLECRGGHWLVLRVVDDGLGLSDPAPNGHGMASLRRSARRHGGALEVRRNPGGGTTVTVRLPT
jgi:signal transduction histidine kinase